LWGKPKTNKVFGVTAEAAEQNRLFAFNQGFYNLFLALAALGGSALGLDITAGKTLVAYALLSMLAAALVLIFSNRKLMRAALVQGLPPLIGLIFLIIYSGGSGGKKR
jgi:putative membrane protein